MKKTLVMLIAVISLAFFAAQQAQAAAPEWKFDTAHSRFYFDIDHTYAKVRGLFEDFSGTFRFDPDNLKESRIDVDIKTKSINTNITKRDNHLRSDDFFAVRKYPVMTFKSTSITHVKDNQYTLAGDLTIKDVTKTVVLPMTYLGMRENPLQTGQMVAGFDIRFTIDRLEYHVGSGKFYQMGVVDKDVDIIATLEVVRDK